MEKYSDDELVELALKAREKAYTPYSRFKVGAALLSTDGQVYTGSNVENAAYTPGDCAERTAVVKAVSEGAREFQAIAIVGGMEDEKELPICAPCGVCRQVLREFTEPGSFRVILGSNVPGRREVRTLEELLPLSFGSESLVK